MKVEAKDDEELEGGTTHFPASTEPEAQVVVLPLKVQEQVVVVSMSVTECIMYVWQ